MANARLALLLFMVAGCDGPFDPNFRDTIGAGCDKTSHVLGRIGSSAIVNFYQTTSSIAQVRDATGTLRTQTTLGCMSGGCILDGVTPATTDATLIERCGVIVASR